MHDDDADKKKKVASAIFLICNISESFLYFYNDPTMDIGKYILLEICILHISLKFHGKEHCLSNYKFQKSQ
jgi:hypothetical protein